MNQYHKIQTVFMRDPATNNKKLLDGQYSLPEFEYLKDNQWVFTEKVDGTNIRVMFDGENIAFGGKTDNAAIPAPLVARLQERFFPQLETFKSKFTGAVCLYGEGYGAKIQSGGNYRPDQDFVLFDVKIDDWWLQRPSIEEIAQAFGLDVVPVIGCGTLAEMIEKTRAGFPSLWGNFTAEGIVARPTVELKTRRARESLRHVQGQVDALPLEPLRPTDQTFAES